METTDYPRYLHTPQGVWVQRVYGQGIYALTRRSENCEWLVSVATARLTSEGWEPAYKRHYSTPIEAKSNEFLLASVRAYMAEVGGLLATGQKPEDHPFPPEV